MSFFPGLGGLLDDLGTAVSGVIDMDPDQLESLKKTLQENAAALEGGGFQDLSLNHSAFGASPAATTLAKHHELAHAIVADTIRGVTADLRGFHDGVVDFERGMEGADSGAAADLRGTQGAVDSLLQAARHNDADRYNYESRQHNLPAEAAGD